MICFDFLVQTLNNLEKEPINKIKEVKEKKIIKITKNISQRFKNRSIVKVKDLVKVLGTFCNNKFLLGIK